MTHNFKRVINNTEKSQAYKLQIERLNLAREHSFYFECIFILYALFEDRISSFLFHAGVTNNTRLKITTNKKVRPGLMQILNPEHVEDYDLKNISQKISFTQQILKWSTTLNGDEASSDYLDMLWRQITKTKRLNETIALLDEIIIWRDMRNQLVHALVNKSPEGMQEKLLGLTDDGYRYWQGLNRFVNNFCYNNAIRKQFHIQ